MIALPLVTNLHVQIVNVFFQFLGVLQEDVEDIVVILILPPAVPAIVVAGSGVRTVMRVLLGGSVVSSQIGKNMQVFQTVDRIVDGNIALQCGSIRLGSVVFYESDRVGNGVAVESIFPGIVVGESCSLCPLVVTVKVLVVLVLIQTDGLGGIHSGS